MSLDQPEFARPHDLRDFDKGAGTGMVAYSSEKDLHARFYIRPYLMEFLSEQMGHPIFQDRIWIEIIVPANNKTRYDTLAKGVTYVLREDPDSHELYTEFKIQKVCDNGEATDMDKYPKAWANFEARNERKLDVGFPIDEWPVITRSYAESLTGGAFRHGRPKPHGRHEVPRARQGQPR